MSLRALIARNFWLKIFSIALGTVIWLSIHHSIDHDFDLTELGPGPRLSKETVRVKVTPVTSPGDTRAFNITPPEVVLTIIGEAGLLTRLEAKQIRAYVDLSDFQSTAPGLEDVQLFGTNNINVIDYQPHTVNVQAFTPNK